MVKTPPDDEEPVVPPQNHILAALQIEQDKLLANARTQYDHPTGRGEHREGLLRTSLEARLPQNVGICKGIIQDSSGVATSEIDILLYNTGYRMVITQASDNLLVLPVESVLAAIEVRTKIDKSAIEGAIKKVQEISSLECSYYSRISFRSDQKIPARQPHPSDVNQQVFTALIGYNSISAPEVIKYCESDQWSPDAVVGMGDYGLFFQPRQDEPWLIEHEYTGFVYIIMELTLRAASLRTSQLAPKLVDYFKLPIESK